MTDREDRILETLSIMVDYLLDFTGMSYRECYEAIVESAIFQAMLEGDTSGLHNSPKSVLIDICEDPDSRLKNFIDIAGLKHYLLGADMSTSESDKKF